MTLPIYRGREQHGKGREAGDKGTGSGRAGYGRREVLIPKKDGTYRLILNLKNLNEYVEYHHFKMDTLQSAIWLMKQNCYMASVDLRDAYYSVPIDEE